MRQVRRDGAVAMDYRYNARGERVLRSGSGGTVVTVYDEAGRWLGDYTAGGEPIQQAIWLDDLPVGLLVGAGSAQTLYYLQPDALGSARVAIDPVRDVAVWRWDLSDDAFGASPPQEDPDGDGQVFRLDLRFPGQRFDAASGLYHNYFRDYDPTVGRHVQSDPIGLLGGMSTYGYANHAPGSFSDPMGLFGKKIGGGIANMLVRPIVQRLGGGIAARAASAAAHARAQARRAAEMAQRMQTVLGRILKGRSRKGGEPAGCDDLVNFTRAAKGGSRELYRLGQPAKPLERTFGHALSPQQYVEDVATHYGLNLRGSGQKISILYDETLSAGRLGVTYASEGGRVIRVGPGALADQATTANTIAHELSHARDYLRGIHKPHGVNSSIADGSVYGSGNALEDWIRGGDMSNKEWTGVPVEKIEAWQTAFNSKQYVFELKAACPVCGHNALRRYYYLGKAEVREIQGVKYQSRGSVWEWCSSCRTYSHAQAFVPAAWGNFQLDLDHSALTPIPDVLDDMISSLEESNVSPIPFLDD